MQFGTIYNTCYIAQKHYIYFNCLHIVLKVPIGQIHAELSTSAKVSLFFLCGEW